MRKLKELPQQEDIDTKSRSRTSRAKMPLMKLSPTDQSSENGKLLLIDSPAETSSMPVPEPPPVPEFVDGIACESTFLRVGKKLLALRRHRELGFRKLDPEVAVEMYNQYPKRFVELLYQVCIYRYESCSGEVFDTDFHINFDSASAGIKEYFQSLAVENKLRKTRLTLSFSDGMSHTVEFIAGSEYDEYEHDAHVMILTSIIEGRSWAKLQSEQAHFENVAWRMKLLGIDNWFRQKLAIGS